MSGANAPGGKSQLHLGIAAALASAVLFGVTTPLAKQLLRSSSPLLIAGLLYLGSGAGVALWRALGEGKWPNAGLSRSDWKWLAAATIAGGICAPALLMTGLSRSDAATVSLLLNLEAVFGAVLAWFLFGEATSRRVVVGFLAIFAGGLFLTWPTELTRTGGLVGPLCVIGACACWGFDNNATRCISAADSRFIAAVKGVTAGSTSSILALSLGARVPALPQLTAILLLGFFGYGVSLVLYVVALRHLGTARTGAYFSTAPFIGSALSLVLYGQSVTGAFWLAAALMAAGVWLHVTEHHEHEHLHEKLVHTHAHWHDEHHQHSHAEGYDERLPTRTSTSICHCGTATRIFRTSTIDIVTISSSNSAGKTH